MKATDSLQTVPYSGFTSDWSDVVIDYQTSFPAFEQDFLEINSTHKFSGLETGIVLSRGIGDIVSGGVGAVTFGCVSQLGMTTGTIRISSVGSSTTSNAYTGYLAVLYDSTGNVYPNTETFVSSYNGGQHVLFLDTSYTASNWSVSDTDTVKLYPDTATTIKYSAGSLIFQSASHTQSNAVVGVQCGGVTCTSLNASGTLSSTNAYVSETLYASRGNFGQICVTSGSGSGGVLLSDNVSVTTSSQGGFLVIGTSGTLLDINNSSANFGAPILVLNSSASVTTSLGVSGGSVAFDNSGVSFDIGNAIGARLDFSGTAGSFVIGRTAANFIQLGVSTGNIVNCTVSNLNVSTSVSLPSNWITNPVVSVNNTSNCSIVGVTNTKKTVLSGDNSLAFCVQVTPVSESSICEFEFDTGVSVAFATKNSAVVVVSGYYDYTDPVPLYNVIGYTVPGTSNVRVKFQSASTGIHYLNVYSRW